MADYGFRISKAGVDVKTGDDKDMVITSKYAVLKGTLHGSGTKVLNSGDRTQKGTVNELASTHNLGYIPFIQVWVKFSNSNLLLNDKWYPLPLPYVGAGGYYEAYYYYSDSTKLYLDFYWQDDIDGGSNTVTYQYFIFIDKGKL